MATHRERIVRQRELLLHIPRNAAQYPDTTRLLELMEPFYEENTSPASRRRAIQRDLKQLLEDGRIEVANANERPPRYRRILEESEYDPYVWAYLRKTISATLSADMPGGPLEKVSKKLLDEEHFIEIDDTKFRIIGDSQRLTPAPIKAEVIADTIEAVVRSRTMAITYRNRRNEESRPVIHPQGLLQRGPRVYVYALKNDESDVRMYALDRIIKSNLGEEPARVAPNFSLDERIREGDADFGRGEKVKLVLLTQGYAAGMLYDCMLSEDQIVEDEPEGSDFELKITATVPSTGQLMRWLLSLGDKVEVLEPEALRQVIASQTSKAAQIYQKQA